MQSNTFKNTMWLSLSYAARMGSQAFVFVLLARALGVSNFGLLAAAIAAANVIAPIVEYGANTIPVSEVVSGVSIPRTTGISLVLSFMLLPVNLIMLCVIKLILLRDVPWDVVILVGVINFVGNRMILLANTIHISQGLLWRNAVVDMTNGFSLILIAFLFLYLKLDVHTWVLWWMIQSIVVGIMATYWIGQTWGKLTWDIAGIKKRLSTGLIFTINGTATSAYADFDKTLLSRLSTAESIGVFTSSHRIIVLANVPLAAFIGAVYPKFFEAGNLGLSNVKKFVWKILPYTIGYSLIVTTIIWFVAPILSQILGDGYAQTTDAIRWLCLGVILQCIYLPFMEALTGSGYQVKRTYGQLTALVISTASNLWLIPLLGWRGAAISSLGGQLFLVIYMVFSVYSVPTGMSSQKLLRR
jgi:O-antigen/teichoic acid export membrane protein